MDFETFTELIRDEIEKKTTGCRVRLDDVTKNNGVVLRGLTVMRDDSNVSPIIYLNSHYDDYVAGRAALPDAVRSVLATYSMNKINRHVDMQFFLDYNDVKKRIACKLVNTEKNKSLLADVPHVEFMDLSVVFQCVVMQEDPGMASILIRNAHMDSWGVSPDELYRVARENTPRIFPYEIRSVAETLCDLFGETDLEECNHECFLDMFAGDVPMFVLSNRNMTGGAVCMLYEDALRNFAETIGSDFFIIPSSVHELILVPSENEGAVRDIKDMIREINDTQVRDEEILSYSLYFYNRDMGKIVRK